RDLCALRRHFDLGRANLRIGGAVLRGDASAGVHRLREIQAERPLVGGAEARLAQIEAAAAGAGRAGGVGLLGRRREAGKLRLERFGITGRAVELRQVLAARLVLLTRGTHAAGARELDRLTLRLRNAEGVVERELDARADHLLRRRAARRDRGEQTDPEGEESWICCHEKAWVEVNVSSHAGGGRGRRTRSLPAAPRRTDRALAQRRAREERHIRTCAVRRIQAAETRSASRRARSRLRSSSS